ncbi:hypothetical protein [Cryobacterium breve]|uniref:hypothetical protein n=1 Tax=Cryobacterium breve TaxID=1259258 RepID=UPI00248B3024|nr:hypothetical protein [Cryobacterium breve]
MSLPLTRRVPIWLAIVASSLPMFMATLDNLVVTGALPVINRDLGASIEEPAVGDQCLLPELRDLHADGRRDRRPLRPPYGLPRRDRDLHGRLRARGPLDRALAGSSPRGRSRASGRPP